MTKRLMWVALAVSLIATGCKKDGKKADGTGGSGEAVTAEKPAGGGGGGGQSATPSVALPQGVDRLLAALPADSEIVIGLDTGRLRASTLLGPLIEQMMTANATKIGFDMQKECGIDPAKSLGRGVVGLKMTSASSGEFAGAFTGMDRATMLPCFEKARAKIEAQGVKLTVDGDYVFMTKGGNDGNIGLTVTADNVTMVRFSSGAVDKATLQKMVDAKPGQGLTGSKEFMGMMKATNTSATIWGLANGGSPLVAKLPAKFKAAFGSIDITDGVIVDARMRMGSADEATKLAQMFSGQLDSVKQMGLADTAAMVPDGADVKLAVTMKKQHVETLKTLLGAVIGNAMKSGMGASAGSGAAPTGP